MFTLPQITVRKGQPILFDNIEEAESFSIIDENESTLFIQAKTSEPNIFIPTTQLEKGKYLVVALSDAGDILQIIPVNIIGLFDKEDRVESSEDHP
ncbi:MAG: hypothetical protein RSE38_01960 [Acinetobacter sp.]